MCLSWAPRLRYKVPDFIPLDGPALFFLHVIFPAAGPWRD